MLYVNLEKSGRDRFRQSDIGNLLRNESSIINFSEKEFWRLAEHVLSIALEVQIFRDRTPTVEDLERKEFEIAVRKGSVKAMTEDVRKKYTNFHASRKAEQRSVEEFEQKLSKEYKRLDEYQR